MFLGALVCAGDIMVTGEIPSETPRNALYQQLLLL